MTLLKAGVSAEIVQACSHLKASSRCRNLRIVYYVRFEVLAAGSVITALLLGVDALETTAAIFGVGVHQTRRQHIAEFFQPMCAMTVLPYFILYSVLR